MASLAYNVVSKKVENQIFRHNWIFTQTCVYKQTTLKKLWNSNIFVQILYSYFSYTGGLFIGRAILLLSVILSDLYEKPRRNKDCITEKSTKKNLWERYHFFDCTPSLLCHFLLLSSSALFRNWGTCWMTPIKVHNISMVVPCVIWKI